VRRLAFAAMVSCVAVFTTATAIGAPAELMDVRRELAAAVAAHDMQRAAALIRFPVDGTSIEEAEFLRNPSGFRILFDTGQSWIVTCLERETAVREDSPAFRDAPWVVVCGARRYYFGQFSGRWRLAAFDD
jgi:hypothetical protein